VNDRIDCKICEGESCFLCVTQQPNNPTTLLHYRCFNCGTVFIGNEITSDDLTKAYESVNWTAYYEETESEVHRKMASSMADLEKIGLLKDSAILDIGTGNGAFPALLHEAGYTNVACHEIPGAEVPMAKRYNIPVFHDFDYSSVPINQFTVITLLDVVEHVVSPHSLFMQCNRMLQRNGLVYFHTPIVTKMDRLMHQFHSLPFLNKIGSLWQRGRTSVFHLQNYTPKSLEYVLRKNGFEVVTMEVKNELSWPVTRYVRVYFCDRLGIPSWMASIFMPLFWPLLATNLVNANKAIVTARKTSSQP